MPSRLEELKKEKEPTPGPESPLQQQLTVNGNGNNSPGVSPERARSERMRVLVRVRPSSSWQIVASDPERACVTVDGREPQHFRHFDQVLGPSTCQTQLFSDVGLPLISSVLAGINSTVCVYGQTGSGKTHSMLQPPDKPEHETPPHELGLAPRMLHELLERTSSFASANGTEIASLHVTAVQLYQEHATDLLNPDNQEQLIIRKDKQRGMHCSGAEERLVESDDDVRDIIRDVQGNRQIGETMANKLSSRSHVIITAHVSLRWHNAEDNTTRTRHSKLQLVDLAGSERHKQTAASGQRFAEASKINRSLSALTNVILALAKSEGSRNGSRRHVPYRDSKLTFLLSDSIGAGSRTVMVSHVSGELDDRDETLSTLRLAQRAKAVRSNTTVSETVEASSDSLEERCAQAERQLAEALQREQQLKQKLSLHQSDGYSGTTHADIPPSSPLLSSSYTNASEDFERLCDVEASEHDDTGTSGESLLPMESNVSPLTSTEMHDASTQEDALLDELDFVTDQLEYAVQQNEGLKSQVDDAERRIAELDRAPETPNRCNTAVHAVPSTSESEAQKDDKEAETLRSELFREQERTSAMQVELDSTKEQMKLAQDETAKVEQENRAKLESAEAEISRLQQQLESGQERRVQAEDKVRGSEEGKAHAEKRLEDLQRRLEEEQLSTKRVEESLSTERDKRRALEIERDDAQDALNAERGKRKSLEREREHVKKDKEGGTQRIQDEKEELERERQRLECVVELKEDDSRLLKAAEARAHSAEVSVERLTYEKDELERMIEGLTDELEITRNDARNANECVEQANAQLETAAEELTFANEREERAHDQAKRFQKQLAGMGFAQKLRNANSTGRIPWMIVRKSAAHERVHNGAASAPTTPAKSR
jgi:kinesin family protein 15